MKKYLLIVLLAMFSLSAHAEWGWQQEESPSQEQDQNQRQNQHQGQDQDQRQSVYNKQNLDSKSYSDADSRSKADADSNSYSGSYSKSNADADAKSYSDANSDSASKSKSSVGDQSVRIRYEAVASSAAELSLPYCGEGVSAQGDKGGFAMANTNFICESQMALKMSLILVEMELNAADVNREKDPDLAIDHLVKADMHMRDSEEIIVEVQKYIHNRSNSASVAAVTKDFLSPILFIGLLVLLL